MHWTTSGNLLAEIVSSGKNYQRSKLYAQTAVMKAWVSFRYFD
jgi:hypothetical protein